MLRWLGWIFRAIPFNVRVVNFFAIVKDTGKGFILKTR